MKGLVVFAHLLVWYLLIWSLLGQVAAKVADAHTLAPDKFKRRTYHSVALLRNHLYIEGGKISTYLNGEATSYREYDPVNTTLYIPLDVDWTNRTLELKEIQHAPGMPTVDHLGLWADERDGGAIYRWAGRRQLGQLMGKDDPKTLWELEPGSDGNGSWTATTPGNPKGFDTIIRTRDAASVSCDGLGLYIGGITDTATEYNMKTRAIPGTLIYNMDSREWTNSSSHEAFQPEGLHKAGTPPVCTTRFGGRPLVFLLGGEAVTSSNRISNLRSFQHVTILDPVKRQWYEQRTTGGPPLPRRSSCAIGAHGNNGTYEIFMYGGVVGDVAQDDIWVLTIPGFHWVQTQKTGPPRYGHGCALAGKRQMISVGGLGPKGGFEPVDEWYAGIGVFDLSTLEWKDRYEANAEDYDSPSLVKSFYTSGGMDGVGWFNDTVKNMFLRADGGFTSSNSTPLLDIGSSRSPPVAAIAGGVFGGVAVILLVLAAFWFWHHHWQPSDVERVGTDVGAHELSCDQLHDNGTPKAGLATRRTHNLVTGREAEADGIPMSGMAAREAHDPGSQGGAEIGSFAKAAGWLPCSSTECLAGLEAPLELQEMNS